MRGVRGWLARARDILFLPGTEGWWVRRLRGSVLCLLYHRMGVQDVEFLARYTSPQVTPEELDSDIRFLQRCGGRFLTFKDLRDGVWPGSGEFGVVIAFDDGLKCNHGIGRQVVEAAGIRAVIFQTSGCVDAAAMNWEHALYWHARSDASWEKVRFALGATFPGMPRRRGEAVPWLRGNCSSRSVEGILEVAGREEPAAEEAGRLAAELYPTAEEVASTARAGHEIGSHGHRHYRRSTVDAATFEEELVASKESLSRVTVVAPEAFAYPFGSFLPGDDEICRRHYRQAAVVDGRIMRRSDDPYRMSRCTWPGPARNAMRKRRWLLTGRI